MVPNRLLLPFVLLASLVAFGSGCNDDCANYCADQGDWVQRCLEQFDQNWSDLAGGYANRADFVTQCTASTDAEYERDVEETCGGLEGADRTNCETTVRESVNRFCEENAAGFLASCEAGWTEAIDFTPDTFDPEEPGDDDDSAADDDDATADDDDDATADDDDDATADDDDATGDDDDSAAGDDDDSAAGDDDDSAVE